eukprot:2725870-Rhodomonas_salina.1
MAELVLPEAQHHTEYKATVNIAGAGPHWQEQAQSIMQWLRFSVYYKIATVLKGEEDTGIQFEGGWCFPLVPATREDGCVVGDSVVVNPGDADILIHCIGARVSVEAVGGELSTRVHFDLPEVESIVEHLRRQGSAAPPFRRSPQSGAYTTDVATVFA